MELEQIKLGYGAVVQILILLGSLMAFYWKMKIDIAKLYTRIVEIEKDREKKWSAYHESSEKNEACMDELLRALSEIKGDIKEIKTNIDWLKKQN